MIKFVWNPVKKFYCNEKKMHITVKKNFKIKIFVSNKDISFIELLSILTNE